MARPHEQFVRTGDSYRTIERETRNTLQRKQPRNNFGGPAKRLDRRRQFKDAEAGQARVAHRRHRKGHVRIELRFAHICRLAVNQVGRSHRVHEGVGMQSPDCGGGDRMIMSAGCDYRRCRRGSALEQRPVPNTAQDSASRYHGWQNRGQNRALALAAAVRAAKEGAQATRHIVARRGRSSYLGDRALGHPDPGAVAVGVWLEAEEFA
jgi:hypothetical protein